MPDTSAIADRIGDAAARWLEALDQDQRPRVLYAFESPERFVWDYLPGARRGLPLADMTDSQRAAALALIAASLSDRGAAEVQAVMALELVLRELELGTGTDVARRDPGRYGFALFGEPGGPTPWSWRVGGHHLAVQQSLDQPIASEGMMPMIGRWTTSGSVGSFGSSAGVAAGRSRISLHNRGCPNRQSP